MEAAGKLREEEEDLINLLRQGRLVHHVVSCAKWLFCMLSQGALCLAS
jgi:hypothetical protein